MIEKVLSLLDAILFLIKTNIFYRPFLKTLGFRSIIWSPKIFRGKKFVSIGDRVFIRYGARIEVIQSKDVVSPKLIIGSNVNIEQNVHIICGSRIVIEDNVSITGNVAIVDVNHPYNDVQSDIKIGARYQAKDNYVEIGRGSFIGFGSVVLPNVKIGEGVVIGANSVVTTDIPPFSVATGNPAKVIKKFNFENKLWEKV